MAGQRVKRVKGTAVAAAAMAALTASQAPGATEARAAVPARETAEHGPSVSGDTPYRTDLPPLTRRHKGTGTGTAATGGAVPATVFAAYRHAEAELGRTAPGCELRWQLLAAIGQVESGQAAGGRVTSDGTTVTPILGPRLDGGAFAVVRDTDGGAYDGDAVYDRAVGPMQFHPVDVGAVGCGRERRRAVRPRQRLRRGARCGAVSVRGRAGPVRGSRAGPGDPRLQPLGGVSADGAGLVRVLPGGASGGAGRIDEYGGSGGTDLDGPRALAAEADLEASRNRPLARAPPLPRPRRRPSPPRLPSPTPARRAGVRRNRSPLYPPRASPHRPRRRSTPC